MLKFTLALFYCAPAIIAFLLAVAFIDGETNLDSGSRNFSDSAP